MKTTLEEIKQSICKLPLHTMEVAGGIILKNEDGNIAKMFRFDAFVSGTSQDSAAYIAHATNTHAELVKALQELLECSSCKNGCKPDDMTCATNRARVALSRAKTITT